jgi:hypothetical protein
MRNVPESSTDVLWIRHTLDEQCQTDDDVVDFCGELAQVKQ